MNMTTNERIDQLEAQLIATRIVVQFLLQDAPEEIRASVVQAAKSAVERGLGLPLTDIQIEQIEQCLLSMR
jgi:hypothetical protein